MWRLQLFGRFELRDPRGVVVTLPTRKAQGALAILALSPSHSVSRIELQSALWPQALPSRQQTNLRQALSQLRRVLGEDAIVATRDRCRLSDRFGFTCDALEFNPLAPLEGGQDPILLPDLTEAWFEQRRRKYLSHRSPGSGGLSGGIVPLDGFLQLLRWCAEYDPPRALDLLRSNRDIALGIPPRELLPLVEMSLSGCSPDNPLFGWGLFWRGVCIFVSHDVVSAELWLQKAVTLAITHGDRALQIETGAFLSAGHILRGRLDEAQRQVEADIAIASRTHDRLLQARTTHMAGTLLVHRGYIREGLKLLETCVEAYEANPVEIAQHNALRALYHATLGETVEADRLLKEPERFAFESRHVRADVICRLARGLIAIKENEPDVAVQIIEGLLDIASSAGSMHVELYGREAFAVAAWKQRERAESADQLTASSKLRKNLRMGFTHWDKARLAEIPPTR